MALTQISFHSRSLGMSTNMSLLLPDYTSFPPPYPVYYLLHGLSDDHSTWLRRTNLERYASMNGGIPLIIVMPTGHRGWYTNAYSPPGLPYENALLLDIIPFIDRFFPTIPTRSARAIGGLSMGGFGAIKLALKHPTLFSSANAHSAPLLTPLHKPEARPEQYKPQLAEYQSIFGPNWQNGPDDPIALSTNCPTNLRPALHFDCGTSDFLLSQNREFHSHLQSLHYPHTYLEHPGEHNWLYWDLHIKEALQFHCQTLGLPTPTF